MWRFWLFWIRLENWIARNLTFKDVYFWTIWGDWDLADPWRGGLDFYYSLYEEIDQEISDLFTVTLWDGQGE